MTNNNIFKLELTDNALYLKGTLYNGTEVCSPVALNISGDGIFYVWTFVDSGEEKPWFADKTLNLPLFTNACGIYNSITSMVDENGKVVGYTAKSKSSRAEATITAYVEDDEIGFNFYISNTNRSENLPLVSVDFVIGGLNVGSDSTYMSANQYGGRTYSKIKSADIQKPGVNFVNGCIGGGLPLCYMYDVVDNSGIEIEMMMADRPTLWAEPTDNKNTLKLRLNWIVDRLLLAEESHIFGGTFRMTAYENKSAIQKMRDWRDDAKERYGLETVKSPDWLKGNMVEFNMNPENTIKYFTRLDDSRCYELLSWWKSLGYDTIFGVSCNNVGQNWLSPFDYVTMDEVGGLEAESKMMEWLKELDMKMYLWVTTVGIDRDAKEVKENKDWFNRRHNGKHFYAWDSNKDNGYLGYAPDADPVSAGWRQWLKDQIKNVTERGYCGIFIDGCIPRADNHSDYLFPGRSRNGIEGQVIELAHYVAELKGENILTNEDCSLLSQNACHMNAGRYTAMAPYHWKAHWDQGMGGGPEAKVSAPERIKPELAKDYLLMLYASMLPGLLMTDMAEGYTTEVNRPWVVQTLLSGNVPKTHSEYLIDTHKYRRVAEIDEPIGIELDEEHRALRHSEFLSLMKLAKDEQRIIRFTPMTIEGVDISGSASAVGMLHADSDEAILAIMQFGDKDCEVEVKLSTPIDVAKVLLAKIDAPQEKEWEVRELLFSSSDEYKGETYKISGDISFKTDISAHGFKIFKLKKVSK